MAEVPGAFDLRPLTFDLRLEEDMAGHSAWKNIKHKKARSDARKGKIWSKCARAIIVAAKNGGGDPDSNVALRCAIDDAKAGNMPKATIENAIKKGTGEVTGENYEAVMYEGYGPGGVALLIEVLTNNRNRTAGDVRVIFDKHGGNLGAAGSVSYLFASRGVILVDKESAGEDRVMEIALEAGAEDVTDQGEAWQVTTEPAKFRSVREALAATGIEPVSAELTMVPSTTVEVTGETARRVVALMDALEDNDDVQKVHANFDIPQTELATLE
jgi:YebC/PmpR family DNA-binding regulatory protein